MITSQQIHSSVNARIQREMPFGLGNTLFMIAGVIGIATKNGFDYAFHTWVNQEYFVNPLPKLNHTAGLKTFFIPQNYRGCDVGFVTFNVPDNSIVHGYLGSETYFEHCKILIRHYFEMKELCKPIQNTVLIHYRDYKNNPGFLSLKHTYYQKAVEQFPGKKVVVITDNIIAAKKAIRIDCEYMNTTPIQDFYLLSHADYLILSNSTFSWWAGWLAQVKTVAPRDWFAGEWADCPFNKKWQLKDWIII